MGRTGWNMALELSWVCALICFVACVSDSGVPAGLNMSDYNVSRPDEPFVAPDPGEPQEWACVPKCEEKECGFDGCQGICGTCGPEEGCTADGLCQSFSTGDPLCGDGACDAGESTITCHMDCGSLCGDETCNGLETANNCPDDCAVAPPPVCGDGQCNGNETSASCATDCGAAPPVCGDGQCNGNETSASCATDCGEAPPVCGDGQCNGNETSATCSTDCGVQCGDGFCAPSETSASCSSDCPSFCGDGSCTGNESSLNCVSDCGSSCGDGVCNGNENETNCAPDCLNIAPPNPAFDVVGYVDGVSPSGSGFTVNGWACHQQWEGSIDVHLYVGGPAGVGTLLKGFTANEGNEAAVNTMCQTSHGTHRFSIPLTNSEMSAFYGQAIYVYGISPVGQGNLVLEESGNHVIP